MTSGLTAQDVSVVQTMCSLLAGNTYQLCCLTIIMFVKYLSRIVSFFPNVEVILGWWVSQILFYSFVSISNCCFVIF